MDDFSVLAKFMSRVRVTEAGCWEWTGKRVGRTSHMYGVLYVEGRWVRAHRLSIDLFKHPMPADLLACHTCDNTVCVNPDHLYAGTPRQNTIDMYLRDGRYKGGRKATCKRGHPRTRENLRGKQCKECGNITRAEWRQRRKAAGLPAS